MCLKELLLLDDLKTRGAVGSLVLAKLYLDSTKEVVTKIFELHGCLAFFASTHPSNEHSICL